MEPEVDALAIAQELDMAVDAAAAAAWRELVDGARARAQAEAPALRLPTSLRAELARAIAIERCDGAAARADVLVQHFTSVLPRARVVQLAATDEPAATLFHTRLDWARLPRLAAAIAKLFTVVGDAGGDALGAATADAFFARTPTLAVLYARTHYGGAFPLLYGSPGDLAFVHARATAAGLDTIAAIDRYLTAPIIHELCHFAPTRTAIAPLHLDECIGGWLGVHVHRAFAYPDAHDDDAIYAAPWLVQVGQAIARAFGIASVVRAHAGAIAWDAALPAAFVAAAARLGADDWRARRSAHLLADPLAPAPWIALALAAAAGESLADATLASLAALPLVELASSLPVDDDFDRAIVADALRAMCLVNARVGGSFGVRSAVPDAPIAIDARACRVTAARRGDVDTVAPSYWVPPHVGARLIAAGASALELRLDKIAAIPAAAAALCDGAAACAGDGFAIVAAAPPRVA